MPPGPRSPRNRRCRATRAAMRLPQFDGQLKKLFPDYAELLPCGGPDCRILAADGTELGMLLLENGDTERTTAFADTIELALALRADGTVARHIDRRQSGDAGLSGFRPRSPVLQQLERPDAEAGAVPRSRCGDRRDLQQPRDPAGVRRIAERYLTREVNQ